MGERIARTVTLFPPELHYRGEPNEWVRLTRPGQRLHSFLEGLVIAPDGTLYLVDVPHGRILRVTADLEAWSVLLQYDGQPHGLACDGDSHLIVADHRRGLLRIDL